MNAAQRTGSLAAAVLAGALALGACGTQGGSSEDAAAEQGQAAAVDAGDARQGAATDPQRLQQIRSLYPSAGLEVPPAGLGSTTRAAERVVATSGSAPLTQPNRTLRHVE